MPMQEALCFENLFSRITPHFSVKNSISSCKKHMISNLAFSMPMLYALARLYLLILLSIIINSELQPIVLFMFSFILLSFLSFLEQITMLIMVDKLLNLKTYLNLWMMQLKKERRVLKYFLKNFSAINTLCFLF